MADYLDKLNSAQFEAAITLDGPIMIHAGAGTGKTGTLIARTTYMLEQGIEPSKILLLTFTNKAAKEMRTRISDTVGEQANDITASTFHSFCANFLRKYSPLLNINNTFSIIDGSDAADLINILKKEFLEEEKKKGSSYNLKEFPSAKKIFNVYSWAINACMPLKEVITQKGLYKNEYEVVTIINNYRKHKQEKNIMDYDDLLYFTELLLRKNEKIREKINEEFVYVSCDEYQDTNTIQDKILELITEKYKNLCVVGDCNQSIYSFRCANVDNILTFKNRHPGCKVIVLDKNYRSSQEILNLSNKMMSYATEGVECNLHSDLIGCKPILYIAEDKKSEVEYIIDNINYSLYKGIPLEDMAILVRSARHSFALEAELTKKGISYKKFGGLKFFEKAVVKDVLTFFRVLVNHKDEIALYRVLGLYPGIGAGYAKKITEAVATNGLNELENLYKGKKIGTELKGLKELFDNLLKMSFKDQMDYLASTYYPALRERVIEESKSDYSKKNEEFNKLRKDLEDVTELCNLIGDYENAQQFLEDIVLEATKDDDMTNTLTIGTIHSMKGLEFQKIFLLNCTNEINEKVSTEELPEEMRILYVAVTRAKDELHLVCPRNTGYPNFEPLTLNKFLNKDDVMATMDTNADAYTLRKIREESLDYFW